ncbi:MAG TPA: hypothetical protein VJS65_13410, partial [Verrucomicrobiae bacterium]|nr:hypothetical protein [Verrucomicrobiae bacterium]
MRTRLPRRLCSIALFALFVVKGTAVTFTVVNANDNGAGTLRQAILDANATPGIDTIAFNIPPGGSTSITITSATFVVTDPVVIDGTTQPGFASTPVVELTSSFEAPWLQCLQIEAGNSVVRGLSFHGLKGDAVILKDGGSNVIEGNMFGLRRDGVSSHGNSYRAIILINSSFNTIGGTNAAQRNVVAGSANAGINLLLGSSYNRIIGNYVGTDVTGTKARGNYRGISVSAGTNNIIGGAGPGERNIISGSGWTGVQLWIGESNRVVGNYIGTDVS